MSLSERAVIKPDARRYCAEAAGEAAGGPPIGGVLRHAMATFCGHGTPVHISQLLVHALVQRDLFDRCTRVGPAHD